VSARTRRYRAIKGKVVAFIATSFDEDYRCINVHFEDGTCFHVSLRVDLLPHTVGLYDMSTGDSKVIREYVLPKGFH
jgi:hypothetical protein